MTDNKHTDQCIEVAVILIPNVAAEPRGAFAVEDHQLRESSQVADGFSVTGDRLFGFHDGRILVSQDIRPEPAVQRFLVRLQNIRALPKTGVKKRLIILVGGVEILNQAQ
jgi:hypothetical protein